MSSDQHNEDAPGHAGPLTHHATDDQGDDYGHGDEPLGPIDLAAWGAGVLGILAGLLIVACLVVATS